MRAVLIVTLGNRDVQYLVSNDENNWRNGIEISKPEFRRETAKLLEEKSLDNLTFPLIYSAWRAILDRGDHVEQIILIPTDQQPPHAGDTVHVAELFKQAVKSGTGYIKSYKMAIRDYYCGDDTALFDKVKIGSYAKPIAFNPTSNQDAIKYATDVLIDIRQRIFQNSPSSPLRFYFEVTGGVPAVSMAFVIKGLTMLGQDTYILEVPRDADAFVSSQGHELRWLFHVEQQRTLLQTFDFSAALKAQECMPVRRAGQYYYVQALLGVAKARMAMDYTQACNAITEGLKQEPDETQYLNSLKSAMFHAMSDSNRTMQFWDAYDSLRIAISNQNWREVLNRLYEIGEPILMRLNRKVFGLSSFSTDSMKIREFLKKLPDDRRDLVVDAWTQSEKTINPDQYVMFELLFVALQTVINEQQSEDLMLSFSVIERLKLLKPIRNKHVHGMDPVSFDQISNGLNTGLEQSEVGSRHGLDRLMVDMERCIEMNCGSRRDGMGLWDIRVRLEGVYKPGCEQF